MRQRNNRTVVPSYAFITDGQTEVWYLRQMKESEQLTIDIRPEMPEGKTLKDMFEEVCDKTAHYDRVFWIVDADVVIKEGKQHELAGYFEKLKDYDNVVTIVNTPCLEFWYLLHYKDTCRYFEDFGKLFDELKKYLPDYEKTRRYYYSSNGLYCKLKGLLGTAKVNSKKHHLDLDNLETGVSEMWKIFDSLGI